MDDNQSMAEAINHVTTELHGTLVELGKYVMNEPDGMRCLACHQPGCEGQCLADYCNECGEDRTGHLNDEGICPECSGETIDTDDGIDPPDEFDPGDLTGVGEGMTEDRETGVWT